MKRIVLIALFVSIVIMMGIGSAGAENCPMKSGQDVACAFTCKAQISLSNAEELGLSEEQVTAINNLVLVTQKDLDEKCQSVENLKNAICGMICEGAVSVEEINKSIDEKYELKKAKEKAAVAAIENLKGILTPDQNSKLKELCAKCMKDSKCDTPCKKEKKCDKNQDSGSCPVTGKGSKKDSDCKKCPMETEDADKISDAVNRSGKGKRAR